MSIPAWDNRGVLPPVRPGQPGHSADRSPYRCSLQELVDYFGTSQSRIGLLQGFLQYREAMHQLGLVQGYQWINGSFAQDVERLEGRPPGDIDIVNLLYLPAGYNQKSFVAAHPQAVDVFDPARAKALFGMDAYTFVLGGKATTQFVRQVTYWYSMWSHRKQDNAWKGFVEVDLIPQGEPTQIGKLLPIKDEEVGGGHE